MRTHVYGRQLGPGMPHGMLTFIPFFLFLNPLMEAHTHPDHVYAYERRRKFIT